MSVEISSTQIQDKLIESGGNISAVARHFKVSRQTIYNKIKRDRLTTYSKLKTIREQKEMELREEAILQLEQAVKKGNRWAIERILSVDKKSYLHHFNSYNKLIK